MEKSKIKLAGEKCLALTAGEADKLISLGSGGAALLYIYALRRADGFTFSQAASALPMSAGEIMLAAQKLADAGLLAPCGGGEEAIRPLPMPEETIPQYTAQDILRSTRENDEFKAVVDEAQRIMGRTLSSGDLRTLFGIYDHLRLPPEILLMLINHCMEDCSSCGAPKRLSMRAIEKEAYVWFNKEIITLDRAEEYLRQRRSARDAYAALRRVFQISGRDFSEGERQFVDSWLAMGFGVDALAEAYDRTIMKTGKLAWKYMDSILRSWHEKGLHSPQEIRSGDSGAASPKNSPPAAAPKSSGSEAERIRRMTDKL